jgi:hypothetical protein
LLNFSFPKLKVHIFVQYSIKVIFLKSTLPWKISKMLMSKTVRVKTFKNLSVQLTFMLIFWNSVKVLIWMRSFVWWGLFFNLDTLSQSLPQLKHAERAKIFSLSYPDPTHFPKIVGSGKPLKPEARIWLQGHHSECSDS